MIQSSPLWMRLPPSTRIRPMPPQAARRAYVVTSGVRTGKNTDRGAQSDEPVPGHGLDAPYPSRSRPASRQPRTRNVLHGYAPTGGVLFGVVDGDDDIADLLPGLDVPVGLDDLVQRICSVDHRLETS